MHYTLHQLEIFTTVCRLQSVTKAAEYLFLTQPAVSLQLKNLQRQFEIPLTEVIGRRIHITDFGERIAKVAEEILSRAQRIEDIVNDHKGFMTGKLNFSVVSTGKYVLPYFLKEFTNVHSQIEMSIDVTNKESVIQTLIENKVDFALVSIVPDKLNVKRVSLMDNNLNLVSSGQLEVGDHEMGDLSSFLNKHPLIFREKGSATRAAMEQFLKDSDVTFSKRIELVSNEAVKQAVNAGLGLSIMPLIGLKNELLNQELRIIKTKGLPIVTNWTLIYLKSKQLSPVATAFLQYLKDNKTKVIEEHFSWMGRF